MEQDSRIPGIRPRRCPGGGSVDSSSRPFWICEDCVDAPLTGGDYFEQEDHECLRPGKCDCVCQYVYVPDDAERFLDALRAGDDFRALVFARAMEQEAKA